LEEQDPVQPVPEGIVDRVLGSRHRSKCFVSVSGRSALLATADRDIVATGRT
jgi:hypothetical protein